MVYQTKPKTIKKVTVPEKKTFMAAPSGDVVRFIPIGGFEEVGRNMMLLEYKNEIIVIDAGLQFPEETTPGIDYIIPNTAYLESKRQNVKALIITHGHYDHIGAIPHIMGKIGNPPIYATEITKEIIAKRQEDYPKAVRLNFDVVKAGETRRLSKYFRIKFFPVTHNIPDGFGMLIDTPVGKIVHAGEFKFDYDIDGNPKGLDIWKKIGEEKIHTLMIDSTGSEEPGYSLSERVVERELEKIFKQANGRIIVSTFASLLDRLNEIIKIAERLNRRVAISGFSMKSNVQIAQRLGFVKVKKGIIIPQEEISKYHDEKLLILCTGSQGEPSSSLMKVASGEHPYIRIKRGDTVILSSSIVPGNERSVQVVKDDLSRQGADVYHYKMMDIHSSGHAPQEELKTVMKLVKPKFLVPIHGYYFMRAVNVKNAQSVGIPKENCIVMDNGQVAEITKNEFKVTDKTVDAFYVMVDGLGVGDVGEVVLRDRRVLAQEGMVVIIATLDRENGRLLKNPDIISRGFIYLKENQEVLEEIRRRIRGMISRIIQYQQVDPDYLKSLIRDQIGQFLYTKTKRRPMVLPVVIEV